MKFISTMWIVFFIFANVSFAESKIMRTFVDKNVGNINVGEDKVETVNSLYGEGFNDGDLHGGTLCYYDIQNQDYIIFSFHDGIIVSATIAKTVNKQEMSQCKKNQIKDKKLITGRGIQLGYSPKDIIKVYGEPEKKKDDKDGLLIFEYHSNYKKDSQVKLFYDAYLYFKNNKLIKLVIHDGE